MRKQQNLDSAWLFALVWLIGSLVTYGHIVHQFKAEAATECEKQFPNQNAKCKKDVRLDAFASSLVAWPFHWSEEVWK